ncbi:MAG: tRNA (adenosine(37)-N6)-threonylcarbamoyltransferase complex transferase subunit TsaD [Alphaproteobacteria bacterium]|nr:tRNA (adenosine(37)-N6)-threonylcarbamoyltransferase complex transferase subunit TsaD [Alphaproteobacteria bacterium]
MKILGIETSCDETAAAVVDSDRNILSGMVLSQIKEHQAFGGVVPEIAARSHLENLDKLIRAALAEAKTDINEIDGVAATCGPGLIGGLLVGMMAGKAIAAAKNIPFIAVNHLEGHALTPRLTDNIEFPYLLLLVSGGHTQILVAEDVGQYKRWGTTLDDAAGECFDKSAKLMGLPYPGGPHLEKMAALCKSQAEALKRFELPRPMQHRKEPDFSFSGLKTAVRQHVENLPPGDLQEKDVADLSFALQTAIAEVLAERSKVALEKFIKTYKPKNPSLVVSGGVAANKAIRAALEDLAQKKGAKLYAPPLHLCSDNAAMIAWAGLERLHKNLTDSLDFKARPRWPLDPGAEPRQGAGVKA